MRIAAYIMLGLSIGGLLTIIIDGFAPGTNFFHLLALGISLLMMGLAVALWWGARKGPWIRSLLIVLMVLVVAVWGFVGYRCYRISVMPAENDQAAGDALNNSGLYQ
ncbi:MAG TPA: hypothetical protein PLM00_04990 [Spirochaetota bacterium]|nr:hypothetical protein [Spirochaetota bacterium]HPH03518.1 hypothetical protein [Spirochaetota bacterium]HPN82724.1 hypothetical protein [Spirochaetota bacterium]